MWVFTSISYQNVPFTEAKRQHLQYYQKKTFMDIKFVPFGKLWPPSVALHSIHVLALSLDTISKHFLKLCLKSKRKKRMNAQPNLGLTVVNLITNKFTICQEYLSRPKLVGPTSTLGALRSGNYTIERCVSTGTCMLMHTNRRLFHRPFSVTRFIEPM